jgi:hypothetical protein
MRNAFLMFLILLGYVAFLVVAFILVASIFTKRFSRFWQPCFYLCSLGLVALMAVYPITYIPADMNNDFGNNSLMFRPLVVACLALPFVAFKKPQRYFVFYSQ